MTDQTETDDPRIREAVARALMDDSGAVAADATTAAERADVNPKRLFCDNWDTVKQVLEFLKRYLPKDLQGIVNAIIRVGDTVKRLIC